MDDIVYATATGTDVEPLIGPALEAALQRAVANIPEDKRGSLAFRVTLKGVEAEAAVRLFQNLNASFFWQRRRDGGQALGAEMRFSF